jgi:hypothetical protein
VGRLKDFRSHLQDRHRVVVAVERDLCALQEKYETFFGEIATVRETELGQLTEHVLADRGALPGWFNRALDQAQAEVESELAERLRKLRRRRDDRLRKAETARKLALESEQQVRARNLELDDDEERLKARNAELLAGIESFNARIAELGRGFGFFANFFAMRRLAAEKRRLDEEHADVLARIEALRARWVSTEGEHVERERGLVTKWKKAADDAAALSAKIEALEPAQQQIIIRSTLERVLDAQVSEPPAPSESDPACPRCATRNPETSHFCSICAARLGPDRSDFEGSLAEMAELNHHFQRFSEGMQACQEIIGLVRGLGSGIEAFTASVDDVLESERKYPLPKLEIDVPAASVAFGANFDRLRTTVGQDYSLHPKVFAEHVTVFTDEVFTEAAIATYFETMGEELSRQAAAQWE